MSAWLVVLTGVIYLYVALEMFFKAQPAMAVVYFGYAIANAGLYIAVDRGLA